MTFHGANGTARTWLDSATVRRLAPLVLLAVIGVACGVPGGEVVEPTPETVVGTVPVEPAPVEPAPTVPPEYADGDPAAGKEVFASAGCGACHVLADAGATGTVGPNLDETKPSLAISVDRVVNGKGTMPPFKAQLTAQQIADVSAYVVEASGGEG
jgi:mono/diheme cytochrome c family protein